MTSGVSNGLFVIIAVVIFGIFVSISYLILRDKLSPTLATVFKDGLSMVLNQVSEDIISSRKDDNYVYAQVSSGNMFLGTTDVWLKLEKTENNTFRIVGSDSSDDSYTIENSKIKGNFWIPRTVDSIAITEIGDNAFYSSKFTGDFNAPYIKKIGNYAFNDSSFNGSFYAPNVQTIGFASFYLSTFQEEFNAPNVLRVEDEAFTKSSFKGSFIQNNLVYAGDSSFKNSNFSGEFVAPLIKRVEASAFENSVFTENLSLPNAELIGFNAFKNSTFSGHLFAPKALEIWTGAFLNSDFTSSSFSPTISIKEGAFKK